VNRHVRALEEQGHSIADGILIAVEHSIVRRLAAYVALALMMATLALPATADEARARGNVGALNVDVAGGPLSEIKSSPLGLSPSFAPMTTDYVWHCQSGINKIQLTVTATSEGTITIDGRTGPTLTIQKSLIENQALIVSAPDPSHPNGAPVQYWIRCLPHDFPQLSVSKPGTPTPGWYLTGNIVTQGGAGTYAMVLDNNGTPVWYRMPASPDVFNVTLLTGATIAWASYGGGTPDAAFEAFNLETMATSWLKAPIAPTDFHELDELPNGDLMMLSSPLKPNVDLTTLGFGPGATIVDCVLQEVDPNGQLVWEWRASDHVSVGESTHPLSMKVNGQTVYDTFHCNSIDTDIVSGNVLLSSRHTDAVYLIDKTSGKVIWKMGGNSPNHDDAQILTITDDPDGAFHAQHDARFQPNDDISLYDDQTWDVALAARGVEYHIDTDAATATLMWSYTSPDGHNSMATGSLQRLEGGNDNVIGWGYKPNALFTEVDVAGNVMLDVALPAGELAYRVQKVSTSAIDHTLLRATAGLPPTGPPATPLSQSRVNLEVALSTLTVVATFLSGFAWLSRRRRGGSPVS
jgi:arylsulfotransferase ASST